MSFDDVADVLVEQLSKFSPRDLRGLAGANRTCRRTAWASIASKGVKIPKMDPRLLVRAKTTAPALKSAIVVRSPVDSDSAVDEMTEAAMNLGVSLVVEKRSLRRCVAKKFRDEETRP